MLVVRSHLHHIEQIEVNVFGSLQSGYSDYHDVTVEVPGLLINVVNRLSQQCPGFTDTGMVFTVASPGIVLQISVIILHTTTIDNRLGTITYLKPSSQVGNGLLSP